MSRPSRQDRIADVLKFGSSTVWLQLVRFGDLQRYTVWEVADQIEYWRKGRLEALAAEMSKRNVRFKDFTPAQLLEAVIKPGRWGMSRALADLLIHSGLTSMCIIVGASDEELDDIPRIGPTTIKQIRAAQWRFERGER